MSDILASKSQHRLCAARSLCRLAGQQWPVGLGATARSWSAARSGAFQAQAGHSVSGTIRSALLRSQDGGESWTAPEPEGYLNDPRPLTDLTERVDFTAPGFAMRVVGIGYHGTDEPQGGFLPHLRPRAHLERPLSLWRAGRPRRHCRAWNGRRGRTTWSTARQTVRSFSPPASPTLGAPTASFARAPQTEGGHSSLSRGWCRPQIPTEP